MLQQETACRQAFCQAFCAAVRLCLIIRATQDSNHVSTHPIRLLKTGIVHDLNLVWMDVPVVFKELSDVLLGLILHNRADGNGVWPVCAVRSYNSRPRRQSALTASQCSILCTGRVLCSLSSVATRAGPSTVTSDKGSRQCEANLVEYISEFVP